MDPDPSTDSERIQTELSLLEAIYPNEITYDPRARDITYTSTQSSLCLRLPPGYPSTAVPDVLSATGPQKQDQRNQVKDVISRLAPGEEALDEIIAQFNDLVNSVSASEGSDTVAMSNGITSNATSSETADTVKYLTVIVWLHHLLSTTKRKAILSPPVSTPPVSGLSKPGYPGVLIFSGPAHAVREHVRELKGMRWQAFHVRFEEETVEIWRFGHEKGVKEVEGMGEVVAGVSGQRERDVVVRCLGIK